MQQVKQVFIVGPRGCGKTTLASSLQKVQEFHRLTIYDNMAVATKQFLENRSGIFVFQNNKDFPPEYRHSKLPNIYVFYMCK